jgi:hypothetical protein
MTTPAAIAANVQDFLKGGPYECSSLESLVGGTANFVFRGHLIKPFEDGSLTIIVKHTESYVAGNPNFKLAETRCVRPYRIPVLSINPKAHIYGVGF